LRAVAGALGGAWTQFKDLGEPAPAPEAPADDHLYAEGAVFAKPKATAYHDTVWQSNPPRMLRYKANVLHGYGWVPGLIPRNFKGTVLCDPHLQGQVLVLWLWMLFIRSTGLYAAPRDQKVFVLFFGTPYMTAILNLCMVITFCLGLFVTLVVNRWRAAPSTPRARLSPLTSFAGGTFVSTMASLARCPSSWPTSSAPICAPRRGRPVKHPRRPSCRANKTCLPALSACAT